MKWLKKTAVVSCAIGVLASFAAMVPTSHSTEAAIAVFDAKNIEEAIKIAIQTAKILTEEQKQLALQILNMKKLDVSMLTDLIKRNDEKTQCEIKSRCAGNGDGHVQGMRAVGEGRPADVFALHAVSHLSHVGRRPHPF